MRWYRLLLLALLAVLPACSIFGQSKSALPAEIPPNFSLSFRVLEQRDPPIDYQVQIARSGNVEYETTIRAPRRRSFQGTLELSESQVVSLYDAVKAARFASLAQSYSADPGASNRSDNGERIFYVVAGNVDKRVDVEYATVTDIDALHQAIIDVLPDYVLTGEGGPSSVLDHPAAFVGNKATKVFHHPECDLVDEIPADDRDPYRNEYDALNFGYHPCKVCRPLETRK